MSAPLDKAEGGFTVNPSREPGESKRVFDSMVSGLEEDRKAQAKALGLDENASYKKIQRVQDKNLRMKLAQELGLLTDEETEKMAKGKYNISWKEIYVSTLGFEYFASGHEPHIQEELIRRSRMTQDMFTDKNKK